MNEHTGQQPWATQTPRLTLTWLMTSQGLRMRWNANTTESARLAMHQIPDKQQNRMAA
jgi:hypothetical protein